MRLDTQEYSWPKGSPDPLPEDYSMRGLLYSENYFPDKWFGDTGYQDDEKYFEPASKVHAATEKTGRQLEQRPKAEEQMCLAIMDMVRDIGVSLIQFSDDSCRRYFFIGHAI